MIDKKIGEKIRIRRQQLGYSQDALAKLMGVTFQQVQKYEKGINSLNLSRLVQVANILQMHPAKFFEDEPTPEANASDRESLELMKAFNQVKCYQTRKHISNLIRALAC